MKALILAGGHATRLWPVTKNRAKPLLSLAGKPIIEYVLDQAEDIEKIDKIYIATNRKFQDSFQDYLSQRSSEKYELIIEEQESEEEKLGAIGGIINAIKKKPKDNYLVIGGDNYFTLSLEDFINFSLEKGSFTNACFKLKSVEEAKGYGIVDFGEDKRIQDFVEKPEEPPSRMASTACYFFPKAKLGVFDEYVNYWEGRLPMEEYLDEPGRLVKWISERYDTYAYPFKGKWVDIGSRRGYLRAEREVREGNIVQGEVKNSDLGENVTVLKGCEVIDSEIENSIIFENCTVRGSIVKNSIVGENTELVNKDLRNGLVEEMD